MNNVFITADHWSHIDREWWDSFSPFFSPKELASKGNGSLRFSVKTLIKVNELRRLYGKPIIINSAFRDFEHNAKVGGAPNSKHKLGIALDIRILDKEEGKLLEKLAKTLEFKGIGRYKTFIHLDTRETATEWGTWDDTLTS